MKQEKPPQGRLSLRERLSRWLAPGLRDKEHLIEHLNQAGEQGLVDREGQAMLEGVLQVSELRVRDIMIPRAQMAVVQRDKSLEDILPVVIESAHSRFPVIAEDKGEVVGLLLAKDLLAYCHQKGTDRRFNIRDVLRSAVFVPGSKRLNTLLKEFRASRNHMAIVVDEYGTAAGLVTIEDVLEQIVGEIEDEHDFDEGVTILKRGEGKFTIKAHTEIEDFNEYFSTEFSDEDFDTVGGLVVNALGHLPKRGEIVEVGDYKFKILRADSRRIHLLELIIDQTVEFSPDD